jgi:cyclic-di-AMP phosphodiesterase PgpH
LMRARAADAGWWGAFLPILARLLLVFMIFATLYLFLYFFRREVYRSNARLLAILLVFVLQLVLIRVMDLFPIEHSVYVLPVAVLPIIITILFDAEVGILATAALALLLGILNRFDFTVVLMTMLIGTAACLTSRQVRKRSHFYRIMFVVMVSYAGLIFLVENMKLAPGTEVLMQVMYGSLVGLVSGLLTIGILPFFESLFSITTDITLLELSDLNHPLLKRLALEAPGTYHHSISVGNLSEAAAKAIGANPLLTRVGAYYHDIGKIEIPEYFVENQLGVHSKHEQLAPSMSALILAAHVKRGRLLGEEADVPDDVLNFIEEHHGTMVMGYFYNKALEQGADAASIDKFRYPGPKPQVRETGIAMLADAVEAASRTLDDPKPARIHALIQRIINERFQSGELDECPLTLRDLAKIREAFAQILIGAFHHRVAYPKKD